MLVHWMGSDLPLLPLAAVSIGLLALVALLVFAVVKLRAGRNASGSGSGADRLSEEAFAAATMGARSALQITTFVCGSVM